MASIAGRADRSTSGGRWPLQARQREEKEGSHGLATGNGGRGAGAEKAVKRRVKARPYGRALRATLRVGV